MQSVINRLSSILLLLLLAGFARAQCVDPGVIDPTIDCPPVYQPVCGCDTITYNNECEAYYLYGVTEWSPGPCPSDTLDCHAYFDFEMIDSVTVSLLNTSIGDYEQIEWTVNGAVFSQSEYPPLLYLEEGYNEVCVSIWNDLGSGCNSTYCQSIYAGSPSNMCAYTDCVWPGDANGDGAANIYDLFNIGYGYGTAGLMRPNAHTQWIGQYCPDWSIWTQSGVDYKHLDSDGDGIILAEDVTPIDENYTPDFSFSADTVAGAPMVYLEFDVDTVIIDPTSPDLVSVTAGLYVGDISQQVEDLHGLGLQIYYPQQDLVLPNSVEADYNDNSFFGSTNHLLWLQEDMYNLKRLDLAFSRKAGSGVDGFGRIATAEFIVVSDIIGGRSETSIPFVVNMEGTVLMDANGNMMDFTFQPTAEFTIINNFPSSTEDRDEVEEWSVQPNPASDRFFVQSPAQQTTGGTLQLFDTQGNSMLSTTLQPSSTEVAVGNLARGLYLLRVQTEAGVWTEKVVLR